MTGFKKTAVDKLYNAMFPYEASQATRAEAIQEAYTKATAAVHAEELDLASFESELELMEPDDVHRHQVNLSISSQLINLRLSIFNLSVELIYVYDIRRAAETVLSQHRRVLNARHACASAMERLLTAIQAEANAPLNPSRTPVPGREQHRLGVLPNPKGD